MNLLFFFNSVQFRNHFSGLSFSFKKFQRHNSLNSPLPNRSREGYLLHIYLIIVIKSSIIIELCRQKYLRSWVPEKLYDAMSPFQHQFRKAPQYSQLLKFSLLTSLGKNGVWPIIKAFITDIYNCSLYSSVSPCCLLKWY